MKMVKSLSTVSKLHIANTYFESELSEACGEDLYRAVHCHPVYLQLQYLPFLYADPGDGVLVSDQPDKPAAFPIHFFKDKEIPHYDQIESWGPSRMVQKWAKEHNIAYAIPDWDLIRELNSKSFSFEHAPRLPGALLLHKAEEAKHWLKECPGLKVLKTCFGLAGRGHLLIDRDTPMEKIFRFLEQEWDRGYPVIAEPWVERVIDFSTQWEIHSDRRIPKMIQKSVTGPCQSPGIEIVREGDSIAEIQSPSLTTQSRELSLRPGDRFLNHFRYISFIGSTLCENDERGRYCATRVGDEHFLFGEYLPFLEHQKGVALALLETMAQLGYFGHVGIDAMIYMHPERKTLELHPIVEINARKTMGWVGLIFQRKHFPQHQIVLNFTGKTEGLLPASIFLPSGKKIRFARNLVCVHTSDG
jgi:hypothetical protein